MSDVVDALADAHRWKAKVVSVAAVWVAVTSIVAVAIRQYFDPPLHPAALAAVVGYMVPLLIVPLLVARRSLGFATIVTLVGIVIALSGSVWLAGGLRSSALAGLVVFCLLSGIVFHRTGAIVAVLVAVAFLGTCLVLQESGIVIQPAATDSATRVTIRLWILTSVSGYCAWLGYMTARRLG